METSEILEKLKATTTGSGAAVQQAIDRLGAVFQGTREIPDLISTISQGLQAAATGAEATAKLIDQLHDALPKPATAGWGPGPVSGMPWFSGARHQSLAQVASFCKAGNRKGCDIVQCFTGPEQAETWDEVAGGPTDDPQDRRGVLSFKEGQAGAEMIWKTLPDLVGVLTLRPIPESESNRDGKRPTVWTSIANGERSAIYRRIGRKIAGLDAEFPRKGRVILEIAHEITGSWYAHSILGAYPVFPKAWAQIVSAIKAGYREVAGRDFPHLIWIRPARSQVANDVWTEAWLPDPEFWDGIGLSQHDNQWSPCTAEDPRINWRRQRNAEGLDNIAEIAAKHGKLVGIFEWSSHNPGDTTFDSGPRPDLFTQSMFDWFSKPEVQAILAGESYFLAGKSTIAGYPDWPGTTAYKRLWGKAA